MHKVRAALLAVVVGLSIAACNTNASPGNIVAGPVAIQLAVGSLNDSAGTISSLIGGAGAGTFLNAVATFRGQFGASAFSSPGDATLTGPAALAFDAGGIFSYGQDPFSPPGCAFDNPPDCTPTDGALGMPPAYSPASTDCPPPNFVCGYALGFIYSGAPLTPGQYKIATSVPTNGQNQKYGATATLPAGPTVLPNEPAPTTYASGGATGGGTFTVTVPAGVTETVVMIFQGGLQVAAVETKTTSAVVPDGTLAAGAFSAFAIGADYPFVEAGPPANSSMKPTLTGANGTSDLTVSASKGFIQ